MKKPSLLFVDDRSKRIHAALRKYGEKYDVTIAPSVKEALRAISKNSYDVVSLDHDLNGDDFQNSDDPTSGMEMIRMIQRYDWPHNHYRPLFIIHTSNIFAGEKMALALRDLGFRVGGFPFDYDESRIEWETKLV